MKIRTSPDNLDSVDQSLVDLLTQDARTPYSVLARRTGVNIATARKRVQRLLKEGAISLELIPNPGKLGYHTAAWIGIHVQLSKLAAVAQKLKSKPPVACLSLTTGRYDILVWAMFKSPIALAKFREKDLSSEEGIEWSETMMTLRSAKTPWDRLHKSAETSRAIDSIDARIIVALQKEVRIPVATLADILHISVPTIHQRIERLEREGIIAISAIANPLKLGYQTAANMGLRVRLSKVEEIERRLASNPNIQYVTQTAGRYDIMLWALLKTTNDLSKFIQQDIASIDGIEQSETFLNLEIVKWSFKDFSPI